MLRFYFNLLKNNFNKRKFFYIFYIIIENKSYIYNDIYKIILVSVMFNNLNIYICMCMYILILLQYSTISKKTKKFLKI